MRYSHTPLYIVQDGLATFCFNNLTSTYFKHILYCRPKIIGVKVCNRQTNSLTPCMQNFLSVKFATSPLTFLQGDNKIGVIRGKILKIIAIRYLIRTSRDIIFCDFLLFGMAPMPFPYNGILLIQGNLPRVIQVVYQMYRNIMLVFLSPISIFVYGGCSSFQF